MSRTETKRLSTPARLIIREVEQYAARDLDPSQSHLWADLGACIWNSWDFVAAVDEAVAAGAIERYRTGGVNRFRLAADSGEER